MVLAASIHKLFSASRVSKIIAQVLLDAITVTGWFLGLLYLQSDAPSFYLNDGLGVQLIALAVTTIAILAVGNLYTNIVRFTSPRSLLSAAIGPAVGVMSTMLLCLFLSPFLLNPTFTFLYWLLVFITVAGLRLLVAGMFLLFGIRSRSNVVIYGAGSAGRQLYQALIFNNSFWPVAFVDDSPDLIGKSVMGLRVHAPQALAELSAQLKADLLLIAIPSLDVERRQKILRDMETTGMAVKSLPGLSELIAGNANFDDIRSLSVEDLLGREPIAPKPKLMEKAVKAKSILITGAGGSIGSEICRQLVTQKPEQLVLLDSSEFALHCIYEELVSKIGEITDPPKVLPILGSVQDPATIHTILRTQKIATIYHAAAYKQVPMVEANVIEAVKNNVFGTLNLVKSAADVGVNHFTLISSDKAVRPTNIMGATKRMGELICLAYLKSCAKTNLSIVRFGNVIGSSGSVIPLFYQQISNGGPITVTHKDINRYFMTIPEAAQLVIQAGSLKSECKIFVLDMGSPVKIIDLAMRLARLSGLKPKLNEQVNKDLGEIEVKIVGLRPGEKLYEELFVGDNILATDHPRILTSQEEAVSIETVNDLLKTLQKCTEERDTVGAILAFTHDAIQLVPDAAFRDDPRFETGPRHSYS